MDATTTRRLFGPFYGCDFTFAAMEKMALRKVSPSGPATKKAIEGEDEKVKVTKSRPLVTEKMFLAEAELMRSKWFDYRRMHPVQATFLFAHCYTLGVKRAWRKYIDHEAAERARGLADENVFKLEPGGFTGVWKARQTADLMGLPYDFFVNRQMDLALDGCWNQVPRPCHLYDPDRLANVSLAWDEWTEAKLQMASDPWYLLVNYVGHRNQDAHQEWLISQAKRRARPEFILSTICFKEPMLLPERAVAVFGDRKIEIAREIASSN
ncbi:hypothetical protein [Magnetospirillum molischianum]|uniref:Uncharacterized protein n=1 Tax=Magnetospirillum molischianum DSM 120 TaxID=1150626 RepID=H8FY72_MAGML|nr:hypothetical protein [Magnetospirillum molischianum]CCG43310.1 hypothetical protein PHAMO_80101 [Magnetospirillum molischianum DSM 120]